MFCVTILDIFIIEVSSAVIRDRIVGNVCKVSPHGCFPVICWCTRLRNWFGNLLEVIFRVSAPPRLCRVPELEASFSAVVSLFWSVPPALPGCSDITLGEQGVRGLIKGPSRVIIGAAVWPRCSGRTSARVVIAGWGSLHPWALVPLTNEETCQGHLKTGAEVSSGPCL